MPNWVEHEMVISGPYEERTRLLKGIGYVEPESPVESLCGTYLPLPDGSVVGSAFTDHGYGVALDLWGTKWGDCDTTVMEHGVEFTMLQFKTAWTSIDIGCINLSKLFPTLTFGIAYIEEQPSFAGSGAFRNGHCIYDLNVPLDDYPMTVEGEAEDDESYYMRCNDWKEEKFEIAKEGLHEFMWSYRQPSVLVGDEVG